MAAGNCFLFHECYFGHSEIKICSHWLPIICTRKIMDLRPFVHHLKNSSVLCTITVGLCCLYLLSSVISSRRSVKNSSFHQYINLLQVRECNEVFIYNPGQHIRWHIDWWSAKHIRGWLTGLSSPDFCISDYTRCLWVTSPVRQGLDPLPMVFIVALIFFYVYLDLKWANLCSPNLEYVTYR